MSQSLSLKVTFKKITVCDMALSLPRSLALVFKLLVALSFMFAVALSYDSCSVIRGRDASNTGSGPEFFGFSHPTIQYLIQSLPGARKCSKYQWVKFELPKPQNKQGKRSDYTKLVYQILQVISGNKRFTF